MSVWEAATLGTRLLSEGRERAEVRASRAPCPRCKALRPVAALLVVSGLPAELTGGVEYACERCWAPWRDRLGAGPFMEALGAPAENRARAAALEQRRQDRFRIRGRGVWKGYTNGSD